MENQEKKIEELKNQLEKQNKRLLHGSFVLAIISLLFYLALVSVSAYAFEKKGAIFGAITIGGSVVVLVCAFVFRRVLCFENGKRCRVLRVQKLQAQIRANV